MAMHASVNNVIIMSAVLSNFPTQQTWLNQPMPCFCRVMKSMTCLFVKCGVSSDQLRKQHSITYSPCCSRTTHGRGSMPAFNGANGHVMVLVAMNRRNPRLVSVFTYIPCFKCKHMQLNDVYRKQLNWSNILKVMLSASFEFCTCLHTGLLR